MCGLTGILTPQVQAADRLQRLVQTMTAPFVHRGPDAEGVWVEDGIALGHRRPSILDLSSAGAQPMQSVCTRFVIAFNGEVYIRSLSGLGLDAFDVTRDDPTAVRAHIDPDAALGNLSIFACAPAEMPDAMRRQSASVMFYAGGAVSELGRSPTRMAEILGSSICSIPDDHIDPRRTALFMARSILREVRDGGRTC